MVNEVTWCIGVLWDSSVKLKEKFYRMTVRSTMLYVAECLETKKQLEHKLGVDEMRMLRWMVGVAPIEEKMRNLRNAIGIT